MNTNIWMKLDLLLTKQQMEELRDDDENGHF